MYLLRVLSLRYWMAHRGAFLLSMLGITLGIAVFVAIQVANHSVLAAFGASLDAVTGKATLQIEGGQRGLPDALPARIASLGDVRIRAATPTLSATLYSPTLQTLILVQGVDLFSAAPFQDFGLAQNDQPQTSEPNSAAAARDFHLASFLLDRHAIAISRSLARRHRLRPGDTLLLYSGARRLRFRITSLLDSDMAGQAFGGDFALLDIATAQEAFSRLGALDDIDLIVPENDIAAVRAELLPLVPLDATIARPARRGTQVRDLLAAFQLNLSALSCISLFVGAFLIYNAIAIAVVRRRIEVGTLRALGAGRGKLVGMFVFEAAAIGLLGSLAGLALGLLLAHWALRAVTTTVSLLYVAVNAQHQVVPLWLWWAAPLCGTLLAMLSALPAAIEAANISPRAALARGTFHLAVTSWVPGLTLAGAASLALAYGLCLPWAGRHTPLAGFAAAFCTLGGFALLAPLCTLHGGRLAQRVAGRLCGIEGALAGTNLRRALGRSSLVIAALMVSLAMCIGLAIMVRSFRGAVAQWIETTANADLFVAPATGFSGAMGPGLPRELVTYVRALPGVAALDTLRELHLQIGRQPVQIAANDLPALAAGRRHIRFLATAHGQAAALGIYQTNVGILVSERFRSLLGLGAGDTLTLKTPGGPHRFYIQGVFSDYTPDECLVYMPRPLYQRLWHDNAIDGLALYMKPGFSATAARRAISRRFGRRYQLTLLSNAAIRASALDTFDQTFAVTYALQLIAVLVAAIGIFDTLIALLLERSRETATLRALGASPHQIMKATLIEFGLVGLFAWAMALAAGVALAWELIFVINRQFFGWAIAWSLPLSTLWQSLLLALLAALGAGFFPSRAAAGRHIAVALQTD